jgi:hypothetical protein
LRALAPYLAVALLIDAASAYAYAHGAPLWTVYASLVIALFVVLPGYERWEARRGR